MWWRVEAAQGRHAYYVTGGDQNDQRRLVAQNPHDPDDANGIAASCEQVAAYLNGGERPGWLNDMGRIGADFIVSQDGLAIKALGPNPGELIDRLLGERKPTIVSMPRAELRSMLGIGTTYASIEHGGSIRCVGDDVQIWIAPEEQ